MRWRLVFVAAIVLLLLAMPLAAQEEGPPQVGLRPDAPEYALHGPYWVGTMELEVEPDSERPLPLTVWYPALNPDGAVEEVTYGHPYVTEPGRAIANAAPDAAGAPYPLVIESHGSGGFRYQLSYLAEHLASYGMVVLAADHVGNANNDLFSGSPEVLEGHALALAQRPMDVQREIDFAERLSSPNGELPGLVDLEQIAVIGHSYGGYTTMAAGGGRVHLGPWQEFCDAYADNEAVTSSWAYVLACEYVVPDEPALLASLGFDTPPGEMWPPFNVEGVDAIVPIAPGPEIPPEGLVQVEVPALFIVGDHDTVGSPQAVAADYEAVASTRKGLLMFAGADHFFAVTGAMDPVWDIDRAHDLMNHFTTAFLLDVLKGDEAAHAALAPDAVNFPGITYEAEGF